MNVDQDEPRFVIPDGDSGTSCPAGWLWLVYLYFRPRTFFTHFVIDSTPGLTALCAWFYGIAGIIDQVGIKSMMNPDLLQGITWEELWGFTLLGGIVSGWLYFRIGGWWFRVRLGFAGATEPDKGLARRVYIFASMVVSLPALLTQVLETGTHATPWDSSQSEGSFWHLFLLIFPFWSVWSSYVGVRTAFEVRRGLAVLWFLVLPVAAYGFLILGAFAFFFISALGPADVSHPLRFDQGSSLAFNYPGNWWIETGDEDYDADYYMSVTAMQDVRVEILFYEAEGDEAEAVETTIGLYHDFMNDLQEVETFQRWGQHEGTGRRLQGVIEGQAYSLRVFVSLQESGNQLEIHELWLKDDEATVIPGIRLIRSSFELK